MSDLYIIAAGLGSRMKVDMPKALIPISNGIPCLTTTLQQIGHKFENVFVVWNKSIPRPWQDYFDELIKSYPELAKNVKSIPIESGLGDGHAVLQALKETQTRIAPYNGNNGIEYVLSDDIVIAWGDVFFPQEEIIDELLCSGPPHTVVGIIPAVREDSPYVTLLTDEHMNCMSADFSKYGENHPTGFHDQSVFRFNRNYLLNALAHLHDAFWKNGRYITQGGELSLLYTFHQFYNAGCRLRVYETNYPTLSFNDLSEVASIQQEISTKWHHKFRPLSS